MDEIGAFKTLMHHWGQKPIWITEIGWSTYALEPRANERTDYLIHTYVQALASGVENILWYDFRDDDARNSDGTKNEGESSMGIVYREFDQTWLNYPPKPAYYALAALSELLTGSVFTGQIQGAEDHWTSGSDVHEYRFQKGNQTIIALWKS